MILVSLQYFWTSNMTSKQNCTFASPFAQLMTHAMNLLLQASSHFHSEVPWTQFHTIFSFITPSASLFLQSNHRGINKTSPTLERNFVGNIKSLRLVPTYFQPALVYSSATVVCTTAHSDVFWVPIFAELYRPQNTGCQSKTRLGQVPKTKMNKQWDVRHILGADICCDVYGTQSTQAFNWLKKNIIILGNKI